MVVAPSQPVSGSALEPSLERARELARDHNLIPLRASFVEDTETPVSAFLKLRALAPGEPAFLLESAEQGQRVGRWSFLGFRPREVVRWSLGDDGDPYALAAARAERFSQAQDPEAPPFTGGAVGFFAYDLVRAVEPLGPAPPDPIGLPDMALMLTDVIVAFDHLKHRVTILANVYADEDLERSYQAAAQQIAEVRAALAGSVPATAPHGPRPAPDFVSNMPRETFEAMVARIVEYVHAAHEETDDRVDNEAADVLFHLTVLLHGRGRSLADAEEVLVGRRR